MLPFLGFTVCLTVLQSNRKKNKVNKTSGVAKQYFTKADLSYVSKLPGILPVTDGKSVMVFYFLSQAKVPLCSCSASEKVAKYTLQTHRCEAIYLSDRRTKTHSGCFGYFFFLCYCFSLEWGTNHCNFLLFLLFFQLYSSFRRSLSVLWKSPKNNKT